MVVVYLYKSRLFRRLRHSSLLLGQLPVYLCLQYILPYVVGDEVTYRWRQTQTFEVGGITYRLRQTQARFVGTVGQVGPVRQNYRPHLFATVLVCTRTFADGLFPRRPYGIADAYADRRPRTWRIGPTGRIRLMGQAWFGSRTHAGCSQQNAVGYGNSPRLILIVLIVLIVLLSP